MKTFAILLLTLLSCSAQVADSQKEALAQALYTEEVTRDPEAAAGQYEKIVEAHRQQRAHAATALFRLAEIRRAQKKTEAATALYREFLTTFLDLEPQAKLARQHFAGLGGTGLEIASAPTDEEAENLRRLKRFVTSAPDVVTDPDELLKAVEKNQLTVIDFLLSQGSDPMKTDALVTAARAGFLEVVKRLLDHSPKIPNEIAYESLFTAFKNDRTTVLDLLLDHGLTTEVIIDGKKRESLLMQVCQRGDQSAVEIFLKRGADINWIATANEKFTFVSPLHSAILFRHYDLAAELIEKGALVNTAGSISVSGQAQAVENLTPLHLAASGTSPAALALVETLLEKGADPKLKTEKGGIPVPAADDASRTGLVNFLDARTPLEVATSPEMIHALVEGGATPDPSLLVKHGQNLEIFKFLLKNGTDPRASSLEYKNKFPIYVEIFNRVKLTRAHFIALREAGLVIKTEDLQFVHPDHKEDAFKILILPGLANPDAITVVNGKSKEHAVLPPLTSDGKLLATPLLLMAALEAVPAERTIFNPKISVNRASESFVIDLLSDVKLPTLQPGDILTLTPGGKRGAGWNRFEDEARWHFLKNLNFTVTIVSDDKKREIAIRGDRLAASRDGLIQPYLRARELVEIFNPHRRQLLEITLRRASGKAITFDPRKQDFPLYPGDVIEVTRHSSSKIFDPTRIDLLTADGLFKTSFDCGDKMSPAPTLCELLATTIPVLSPTRLETLEKDPKKFASLVMGNHLAAPPAFDLSDITIIRHEKEETIEIKLNFDDALKALPDEPLKKDIRSIDPQLQRGDIVIVNTRPVSEENAWDIFTPEVTAYFKKIFRGTVRITLDKNKIVSTDLSWSPPKVRLTPFGPFPFAPPGGRKLTVNDLISSLDWASTKFYARGSAILVRQNSSYNINTHGFPLRDGDAILRNSSDR